MIGIIYFLNENGNHGKNREDVFVFPAPAVVIVDSFESAILLHRLRKNIKGIPFHYGLFCFLKECLKETFVYCGDCLNKKNGMLGGLKNHTSFFNLQNLLSQTLSTSQQTDLHKCLEAPPDAVQETSDSTLARLCFDLQ